MKILKSIVASLLLFIGCFALLYMSTINDFPRILGFYSLSFLGYFIIIRGNFGHIYTWLGLGLLIRVISIFIFPSLSDDIYRFIWDGWLITEGINPFTSTPSSFSETLPGFQAFLLDKMNSPDYYSVYPTILQAIFSFTVWCIPAGIFMQSVLMKCVLLGFEIIAVFFAYRLLSKLKLDRRIILIYVLNPLVIVELMGNLHMELIMIAGFSFFLWSWYEKKYYLAAAGLSFSVAAKLITVVVSPFLLRRVKLKKLFQFGLTTGLLLILLFMPLFMSTYENFGKGLDLYFQKFEFNASIYYLLRAIGYWYKGYNIIGSLGPTLALISGFSILYLAWREKDTSIASLCKYLCIGLTIYYFMGTTVHPWYISLLVFLCMFSNLKYPILWSFLAIFSYSKYYEDERYYLAFVCLEYSILYIFLFLEWKDISLFPKKNLAQGLI